jgi:eukaryotic-like serine/threonine-protein kinase
LTGERAVSETHDRTAQQVLEHKFATEAQVDEAKAIVAKMVEMGLKPRSVAEILYERGHLEVEQLEELRREERRWHGQEQIAGYRLLELLGQGAMGSVYKARQLSLDRDVAIKVLSPELAKDATYVQRFQTEARAVARLNHTNLVSGIDVGEADGIHYLVMEYADGNTLASLLRRGGALDEERAVGIAQQIARALDHAHKNGLLHRDVKPDNVIITRDGVAKLCDLGLARLDEKAEAAQRMGTPAYISPEQARGETHVDLRSDLYSLGATLFHLLAGRPPFEAATAAAVLAKHLTEPAPRLNATGADVDPRTDALVARLLAKSPAERPASAGEVAQALDAILRDLQQARGVAAAMAPAAMAPAAALPAKPAALPAKPAVAPKGAAPAPTPRRRR